MWTTSYFMPWTVPSFPALEPNSTNCEYCQLLRHIARSKGTTLGRPRVAVDAVRINVLRAQGMPWAKIGEQLGLGEGTVRRTAVASAKNLLKTLATSAIDSAID